MNAINPNKLLNSKWTAVKPQNKEKHFLVTRLIRDDDAKVIACELEAVMTKRTETIDWQALKNESEWLFGWQ